MAVDLNSRAFMGRLSSLRFGLAISRDLARGTDGEFTAESVPRVGSTFTLILPAAP